MKVVKSIDDVRCVVHAWKKENLRVGLVPTMGFLHEGHESLVRRAVLENDRVVVSIFVNPTQFRPGEDLDRYPRNLESDTKMCRDCGAALVFTPEAGHMYPDGFATSIHVAGLTDALCGKSRPGHFDGVCTVVCKLLNIVSPDNAYFGQKDAQQLAVIRRMCEDLHLPVEIVPCPIVREKDGLAKSSRNSYLNAQERQSALALRKALDLVESLYAAGQGSVAVLEAKMREVMERDPLVRVDYANIVAAATLAPLERVQAPALVAVAAYVGKTRLIDNTVLGAKA